MLSTHRRVGPARASPTPALRLRPAPAAAAAARAGPTLASSHGPLICALYRIMRTSILGATCAMKHATHAYAATATRPVRPGTRDVAAAAAK